MNTTMEQTSRSRNFGGIRIVGGKEVEMESQESGAIRNLHIATGFRTNVRNNFGKKFETLDVSEKRVKGADHNN